MFAIWPFTGKVCCVPEPRTKSLTKRGREVWDVRLGGGVDKTRRATSGRLCRPRDGLHYTVLFLANV